MHIAHVLSLPESATYILAVGIPLVYMTYRLASRYINGRTQLFGYPVLGHALEFGSPKYMGHMIDLCKKYGPIFDVYIGMMKISVLTNAKDVKEVASKRPKTFTHSRSFHDVMTKVTLTKGLFMSEHPDWSRLRRVTAPAFSKKALLAHFQNLWNECESTCKTIISDGKTVTEFTEIASTFTVTALGVVAFGLDKDTRNSYFFTRQFYRDLEILLKFIDVRVFIPLPDYLWRLSPLYQYEIDMNIVLKRITTLGHEIIHKERQKTVDPESFYYLHHLIHADGELKVSEEEIMSNLITVFVAGSDTTSITLAWSMYYMSINKQLFIDVRTEVDTLFDRIHHQNLSIEESSSQLPLLSAVFKESLRLRGPANSALVQLKPEIKELTLQSGITLYSNDQVWLPYDYLNLDPNIFENPENYNPYRWLTSDIKKLEEMESNFFSFGYGPRVCPGMSLSYLEGPLFLAHLIYMYNIELACPPNEVEQVANFTIKCNKCPIIFTPRNKI